MGMDVFGQNPTSKKGEYFRNNIWWWHPLWRYCESLMPSPVWKSTDTAMMETDSTGMTLSLASVLQHEIDSGNCKKYMDSLNPESPEEPNFSVENVQEFVDFLKDCGGFCIN